MHISRTGCLLFDYAKPQDVLFQPSNAYMESARPFGLAPVPMSGGATPMPDETSSSTPAWNPLSRTPRYSQYFIPFLVDQSLVLIKFIGP